VRIGELSQQAGVSTRTLRHYESLGLLPAARSSNGYRSYDEDDLQAVREIRTLVDLGFTLEETRPFLECLRAGNAMSGSCPDSLATYRRKLDEVDAYLAKLTRVRAALEESLDVATRLRQQQLEEPRCAFTPPAPATRGTSS
jgi:DNA-binding transcriptional MerR regulator